MFCTSPSRFVFTSMAALSSFFKSGDKRPIKGFNALPAESSILTLPLKLSVSTVSRYFE